MNDEAMRKTWDTYTSAWNASSDADRRAAFETTYFLAHHGRSIARWTMRAGSGAALGEGFTRAFKKAFGVTPATYRRGPLRLPFPRKVRFDAEYLRHIHANVTLEPELYEQPELRLVGMRTEFFSVDSEKNNIAEKLPSLWGAFLPRVDDVPHRVVGRGYGVVRQTGAKTDRLEYHAATQVTRRGRVPAGMVEVVVPAATYAKFTHAGPVALVDRTVSYIYSSWLLRSGMRHTAGPDLEIYDARYHPESDRSVIEYAIPISLPRSTR